MASTVALIHVVLVQGPNPCGGEASTSVYHVPKKKRSGVSLCKMDLSLEISIVPVNNYKIVGVREGGGMYGWREVCQLKSMEGSKRKGM